MIKLNQNIALTLLTGSILGGFMGFASPSQAQSVLFQCGADYMDIPTTYVETQGGVVEIFKWKSNYFQEPYTPVQRCLEVTERMNRFQPDYLVSGRVNNYNVICAGTSCDRNGSNVLLTLRPDQNPAQVLQEIDNTRDGAGGPSLQFNGTTNILNRYRRSNISKKSDGSVTLNLTRYLQTAPKVENNFTNTVNNSNTEVVTPAPSVSPTPTVTTPPTNIPSVIPNVKPPRAW